MLNLLPLLSVNTLSLVLSASSTVFSTVSLLLSSPRLPIFGLVPTLSSLPLPATLSVTPCVLVLITFRLSSLVRSFTLWVTPVSVSVNLRLSSLYLSLAHSCAVNSLLIADITSMQWRAFVDGAVNLPYVLNAFVAGYIVSDINGYSANGWRWGVSYYLF